MLFFLSIMMLLGCYWIDVTLPAKVSAIPLSPAKWQVSTGGNDLSGDGSSINPFRTIQKTIDTARDGDTVEVQVGIYSGPGNSNLDLKGKAIAVTSSEPGNDFCLAQTVIDGAGEGVIFRFVNDEGPRTVISGFTLRPGNISAPVIRGVPGFFEFSVRARPTISRMRIENEGSDVRKKAYITMGVSSATELSATGYPRGDRGVFWNGHDPFNQPVNTTDYYGSGDIDLDGSITNNDVYLASQIAQGNANPTVRADVDGNGIIDNQDVTLIQAAVNGTALPAWWNKLASTAARNSWIDRVLAVDPTNNHPYDFRFWTCGEFATQLFLRGATYGFDIIGSHYTYGQTVFNIPTYVVAEVGFPHAINAVLVGDDPLTFNDWRFIEPQSDATVEPGMWDMPFGIEVWLEVPESIAFGSSSANFLPIKFAVQTGGTVLKEFDNRLVLHRDAPPPSTVQNQANMWNPRIVRSDPPLLLYERTRDDLSRVTDIHVTDLLASDLSHGSPLVEDAEFSNLLDVFIDATNQVHLLYRGKPNYHPGIFHAFLDSSNRVLRNVSRVAEESSSIANMGRVLKTPDGKMHTFWLSNDGVYWSYQIISGWATPQKILAFPGVMACASHASRDLRHSYFDAAVTNDGDILLVSPADGWDAKTLLQLRYHNGSWGTPQSIEKVEDPLFFAGVSLLEDADGLLHLAYWCGNNPFSGPIESFGFGPLRHRTSTGGVWSSSEDLDPDKAGFPRMSLGDDGTVYTVWSRYQDDHRRAVPVLRSWHNGVWDSVSMLSIAEGTEAWYPVVEAYKRGSVEVAWCERSSGGVTISRRSIIGCIGADFDCDGKADILWRNKTTGQNVVWLMNGTTYSSYVELLQIPDTNWQIVGTGDFNSDGKTDILWRNKSTGQNVVWFMDGVNYGSYAWLLEVADLNWEIVGTGDFNGDGKVDILWRNKSTGQNVVWFMDGATMSNWSWILPEVPDTNWQIVGTGDFNSDGKTDILWRNKSTGQNVVWFMDGVAYGSYAWLLEVADLNWEIVGTGDFNSDGKTDILWRNKSTGQNVVWLMNGTTYGSYTWLPDVPDTNWEIVGPK